MITAYSFLGYNNFPLPFGSETEKMSSDEGTERGVQEKQGKR